jgi:guanylate kinase
MLFVFAAPSGAGKTSIVKRILEMNPELIFSISATTRKKRDNEEDGKDYFFMPEILFEEKIQKGDFVEYERVFDDNYYGTLKSFIDDKIRKKQDVVFDLDVKGAISIKRLYNNIAILIFIRPPDKQTIKNRLINRGTESTEIIEKRLNRFDFEMEKINEFNFVVVNKNLEEAVEEVQKIIIKYKTKQ